MEPISERKETCCCCIPIKTGVITLAIISIISEVVQIGFIALDLKEDPRYPSWSTVKDLTFGVVYIITDSFLLYGVTRNNSFLVRLWVKVNVVLFVIDFLSMIATILIFAVNSILVTQEDAHRTLRFALQILLEEGIWLGIYVYIIYVVFRYSKILTKQEEEEREEKGTEMETKKLDDISEPV